MLRFVQPGNALAARDPAQQSEHAIENAAIVRGRDNQAVESMDFFRGKQETVVAQGGAFGNLGGQRSQRAKGSQDDGVFLRQGPVIAKGSSQDAANAADQFVFCGGKDWGITDGDRASWQLCVFLSGPRVHRCVAQPGLKPSFGVGTLRRKRRKQKGATSRDVEETRHQSQDSEIRRKE